MQAQPKVLAWGIILALVLRLVFILLGAALLDAFHITFYAFGLLLIYTAYKLARHDDAEIEPEHNPALKFLRKRVTMTEDYDGEKIFTKVDGKRVATPLLAVFVVIATTDIIFAVDSIPAIFAVTQEPFIVFAANAFALIGLRALYFLLVGLMDKFVYLTPGPGVHPRVHRREDAARGHLARPDLALADRDRRDAGGYRAAVDASGREEAESAAA